MIPKSIFELVEFLKNEPTDENFSILIGDFLDFVKATNYKKNVIEKEPIFYDNIQEKHYSFLSAVAEKIKNDYNIELSNLWFNNKKYISQNPYFPSDLKGNIRLCLIAESPYEFLTRNMFVSKNALTRI